MKKIYLSVFVLLLLGMFVFTGCSSSKERTPDIVYNLVESNNSYIVATVVSRNNFRRSYTESIYMFYYIDDDGSVKFETIPADDYTHIYFIDKDNQACIEYYGSNLTEEAKYDIYIPYGTLTINEYGHSD